MPLTITDTRIGSTLAEDHANRCTDGSWVLEGPLFTPSLTVTRVQALAALTIADAIRSVHSGKPCWQCSNWLAGIRDVLIAEAATTAQDPSGHPAPLSCLYCGSSDDIYETHVIIDDRTEGYALTCGMCHGVWAA